MEVVILMSSVSGDMATKSRLDSVLQLFAAKGIRAEEVDAAVAENRERREALFKASGVRGVFPQVFLRNSSDGGHRFVSVQEIMEANEDNADTGALDAIFSGVDGYRARGGAAAAGASRPVAPAVAKATQPAAAAAPVQPAAPSAVAPSLVPNTPLVQAHPPAQKAAPVPSAAATPVPAPPAARKPATVPSPVPAAAAPVAASIPDVTPVQAAAPPPPQAVQGTSVPAPVSPPSEPERADPTPAPSAVSQTQEEPQQEPTPPRPSPWVRCVSKSDGSEYFWEPARRLTSWVDPGCDAAASGTPPAWVRLPDPQSGSPYYYCWATGESSWLFPQ